jgi:hypothetical protein
MMLASKDNKLNSSKSIAKNSKHTLIKKIHIQKYLNLKFKPNGEVRSHIAYVSILHSSSIENTSNFLIVFPIPTIKYRKTTSSHELSHVNILHM